MMTSPARTLLLLAAMCFVASTPLAAQKPKAPPAEEKEDPVPPKTTKPPRLEDEVPSGPGAKLGSGTLVIAVRHLPVHLDPAVARSDSERLALDLVFEGLLRPVYEPISGQSYQPGLARTMPRVVTLGREFDLVPDAVWFNPAKKAADGSVTAADVRATVERLRGRRQQPGAEVGEWLKEVTATESYHCRVTLRQGHLDPLALMTFKVLPEKFMTNLDFATHPVGSGPFYYAETKPEGGRNYAIFKANPAYGKRLSRANLPRLAEVRFLESPDPALDFQTGKAHLVIEYNTPELVGLKGGAAPQPQAGDERNLLNAKVGNEAKVITVPSRRIYFLAVNHNKPELGKPDEPNLRRVLAFAINREQILTDCFRAGRPEYHRALTGPFPPGTWPCAPGSTTLDDVDLAQAEAGKINREFVLVLKYPRDDAAARNACDLIQQQVKAAKVGVEIKLRPLAEAELEEAVLRSNDYDLAYWHYDFPSDLFDLGGLLDPKVDPRTAKPGHRNFLNLKPSGQPGGIDVLLTQAQDRRDFESVQATLQRLHAAFRTSMPFIPLWNLDAHLVLRDGIQTVPEPRLLDPLAVFAHADEWHFGR